MPLRILALFSLLCMLPALFSCVAEQPAGGAPFYTFTDDTGKEVSLYSPPRRVAVLFSSLADVWISAGGTVAITVGESVERGFADEGAILVDAGAGKTVNTELLLSASPDLIICSADVAAQCGVADLASARGIPAAAFRIESFSDYLRVLKICTELTCRPDKYEENGIAVKARIDEMLSAVPDAPDVRTLFVRASATSVKAKTAADHFAAAMLEELGAYNIANDAPVLIDGISDEVLLLEDPERIFVSFMGNEESAQAALASNKVWQSLSAVKDGRCHYLPKELFQYKPNARWAEAYEHLIDLLYGKS
jgi:iron complex transport system substrate-binding protein